MQEACYDYCSQHSYFCFEVYYLKNILKLDKLITYILRSLVQQGIQLKVFSNIVEPGIDL